MQETTKQQTTDQQTKAGEGDTRDRARGQAQPRLPLRRLQRHGTTATSNILQTPSVTRTQKAAQGPKVGRAEQQPRSKR